MNIVLAAIDNTAAARPVLAAAVAFADLLDAEVEAVHAREDGDADGPRRRRGGSGAAPDGRPAVVPALREESGAG